MLMTPWFLLLLSILTAVSIRHSSHLALAAPMWTSPCTTVTANYSISSSGGLFEARDCTFAAYIAITASAALPMNTTTVIVIDRGTATAGSTIAVEGFVAAVAPVMGPISITVSNVVFGLDAVLRFTGYLPTCSSLVFKNNQFNLSAVKAVFGTNKMASIGIFIGRGGDALLLYNDSSIAIINNTFVAKVTGQAWAIYVTYSAVTIANSSSVVICGNILRDSKTTTDAALLRWVANAPSGGGAHMVSLSNSSRIAMDNNTISNGIIMNRAIVLDWVFEVQSTLRLVSNAVISLSGNTVDGSRVTNLTMVIDISDSITQLTVNHSAIFINNNTVKMTRVQLNSARVVNFIMGSSSNFSSMFGIIEMSGNSLVELVAGTQAEIVALEFPKSSILSIGNSSITMDQNHIVNSTSNNYMLVVFWRYPGSPILTITNSAIAMCENSLTNITSKQQIRIVIWIFTNGNPSLNITSSTIAMNRNSCWNATIGREANIVFWEFLGSSSSIALTIAANSTVAMDENIISGSRVVTTATVAQWHFAGSPSLFITASSVSMNMNNISHSYVPGTAGTAVLSFVNPGTATLAITSSTIIMSRNSCLNATVIGHLMVVNWDFGSSAPTLTIVNSTVTMDENRISESNTAAQAFVVRWFLATFPRLIINSSAISMDNNSIVNTVVAATAHTAIWGSSSNTFSSITVAITNSSISKSGNSMVDSRAVSGLIHLARWSLYNLTVLTIANSSITMDENRIVNSISNTNMHAVILHIYINSPIFTITNSVITMCGNALVNTTSTQVQCVIWLFQSSNPYLSIVSSTVNISRNSCWNATTNGNVNVVIWDFGSSIPTLTVTANSTVAMDANRVSGSRVGSSAAAAHWYFQSTKTSLVINSSAISMDNNSIAETTIASDAHAVLWNSSSFSSSTIAVAITDSSISKNGNNMVDSNVGEGVYLVRWSFHPKTLIITNSYIAMAENSLANTTSRYDMRIVIWFFRRDSPLFALSNSTVTLSRNSCYNATTYGNVNLVFWYFAASIPTLTVTANSTVAMDENSISRSWVDSYAAVAHLYWNFVPGSASLTIIASSVSMSRNSINYTFVSGVTRTAALNFAITGMVTLTILNQSVLALNGNIIGNSNMAKALAAMLSFSSSSRSLAIANSTLSMASNAIRDTMTSGVAASVLWEFLGSASTTSLNFASYSHIRMDGNCIVGSQAADQAVAVYWTFAAGPAISVRFAAMSFGCNSIAGTNATKGLVVVMWDFSILSVVEICLGSLLVVEANHISNVSAQTVTLFDATVGQLTVNNTKVAFIDNHVNIGRGGPLIDASLVSIRGSSKGLTLGGAAVVIEENHLTLGSPDGPVKVGNLINLTIPVALLANASITITNNSVHIASLSASTCMAFGSLSLLGFGAEIAIQGNYLALRSTLTCPPVVLSAGRITGGNNTGSFSVSTNHISLHAALPRGLCRFISVGSLEGLANVALSGNVVKSNDITYIGATTVDVPANGTLQVSNNNFYFNGSSMVIAYLVRVSGVLRMRADSRLTFLANTVESTISPSAYTLTNATSVVATNASVIMCRNVLFGDISNSHSPSRHLHPPQLVSLVRPCFQTSSVSGSLSRFVTQTLSVPSSASVTATLSDSVSTSLSFSRTLSETGTAMSTRSLSRPITTSISLEMTATCKNITDLALNDTCAVLRPLPSGLPLSTYDGVVHLAASWLSASCTSIAVPFSVWSGREGAVHSIFIAGVDHRLEPIAVLAPEVNGTDLVPVPPPLHEVSKRMPLVLLHAESLDSASASRLPGKGLNHTYTLPIGVLAMRYLGRPTLSGVSYSLNCRSCVRCPVAMPLEFEVTLLASERLMPVAVTNMVDLGSPVVLVGSSLTLSPTSVARMSVTSALRKTSRCQRVNLDDDEDEGLDVFVGGVLNPFVITIGTGDGRRYVRGSLAMSAVYLVGLSGLMLAYTIISGRLSRMVGPTDQEVDAAPLLAGHPSALVAVVAFVADGAIGAGALLGVEGSGWSDKILGWSTVLLCALFVPGILQVTIRTFPRSLTLAPQPGPKNSEGLWSWLVAPTDKWQHTGSDKSTAHAAQWLLRYESYIADSRLTWYCGLEQGVAQLVCLLGALSVDKLPFCIARGVLFVVFLGFQAGVMVLMRPPVHRCRWLLQSAILIVQVAMATVSAINVLLQEQKVELAMDSLGIMAFALLCLSTATDLLMMLLEMKVAAQCQRKSLRRQSAKELLEAKLSPLLRSSASQPVLVDMTVYDERDDPPHPSVDRASRYSQLAPPTSVDWLPPTTGRSQNEHEAETVREILAQLKDFESQLVTI